MKLKQIPISTDIVLKADHDEFVLSATNKIDTISGNIDALDELVDFVNGYDAGKSLTEEVNLIVNAKDNIKDALTEYNVDIPSVFVDYGEKIKKEFYSYDTRLSNIEENNARIYFKFYAAQSALSDILPHKSTSKIRVEFLGTGKNVDYNVDFYEEEEIGNIDYTSDEEICFAKQAIQFTCGNEQTIRAKFVIDYNDKNSKFGLVSDSVLIHTTPKLSANSTIYLRKITKPITNTIYGYTSFETLPTPSLGRIILDEDGNNINTITINSSGIVENTIDLEAGVIDMNTSTKEYTWRNYKEREANDFENYGDANGLGGVYPYNEIRRVSAVTTDDAGTAKTHIMVEFPKFYFKRVMTTKVYPKADLSGNYVDTSMPVIETYISKEKLDDSWDTFSFWKNPDGSDDENAPTKYYLGAYKGRRYSCKLNGNVTTYCHDSTTGSNSSEGYQRGYWLNLAQNMNAYGKVVLDKGGENETTYKLSNDSFSMFTIEALNMLQMLFYTEFATKNSQSIFNGNCYESGQTDMGYTTRGSTDAILNKGFMTGNYGEFYPGKPVAFLWLGLEDLWGSTGTFFADVTGVKLLQSNNVATAQWAIHPTRSEYDCYFDPVDDKTCYDIMLEKGWIMTGLERPGDRFISYFSNPAGYPTIFLPANSRTHASGSTSFSSSNAIRYADYIWGNRTVSSAEDKAGNCYLVALGYDRINSFSLGISSFFARYVWSFVAGSLWTSRLSLYAPASRVYDE